MNEKQRNRLLAVLFLGVLMAAMDIAIVGPALPAIRDGFGVTDRAVAWVFTTYLLANLVGTPVMAKLSDRLGRRDVYVADVVLFVIGSIVVASAPSLPVVLVG
ncbi:MAG: MFS transporter, partial [Anaerolineae bacterium]